MTVLPGERMEARELERRREREAAESSAASGQGQTGKERTCSAVCPSRPTADPSICSLRAAP